MGKQVVRTTIDQIDKIEQSLSLEIAKQTKSKRTKFSSKTKEPHAATKHHVLIPVIISIVLIAIPTFLYYQYADSIKSYLRSISRKEDETIEPINGIEEEKNVLENTQIVDYLEIEDELEEEPNQEENELESSSETDTSSDDIELTK